MTPRIFGISSSIAPKQVKLESSKLVDALPTGLRDNISERGSGLGHMTLENLAYSGQYLEN